MISFRIVVREYIHIVKQDYIILTGLWDQLSITFAFGMLSNLLDLFSGLIKLHHRYLELSPINLRGFNYIKFIYPFIYKV